MEREKPEVYPTPVGCGFIGCKESFAIFCAKRTAVNSNICISKRMVAA